MGCEILCGYLLGSLQSGIEHIAVMLAITFTTGECLGIEHLEKLKTQIALIE
ncbi:hypothetical protein D3C87_1992280 [compost metagenome]